LAQIRQAPATGIPADHHRSEQFETVSTRSSEAPTRLQKALLGFKSEPHPGKATDFDSFLATPAAASRRQNPHTHVIHETNA